MNMRTDTLVCKVFNGTKVRLITNYYFSNKRLLILSLRFYQRFSQSYTLYKGKLK